MQECAQLCMEHTAGGVYNFSCSLIFNFSYKLFVKMEEPEWGVVKIFIFKVQRAGNSQETVRFATHNYLCTGLFH